MGPIYILMGNNRAILVKNAREKSKEPKKAGDGLLKKVISINKA